MRKRLIAIVFFFLMIALYACDKNRVYEKNIDIQDYNWRIEDVKEFSFAIKDTTQSYNIYFNVRNALSYEYYNLYMREVLIGPDGSKLHSKLHEMYLMDKKTGEPLGNGAGDIFDHTILAVKNQRFSKTGIYQIRLTQYMRKNPLPGIMAVGIKIVLDQ